jgi:hypothetical protein
MRFRVLSSHVALSGIPTDMGLATNVRILHEDVGTVHTVYVSGSTSYGSVRIPAFESAIILKMPEDVIWTDGTDVYATKVGYYG